MRKCRVEERAPLADRLINKGDSGGAVYFDGELIGVLWSIGEYGYGPGVNVSLLNLP